MTGHAHEHGVVEVALPEYVAAPVAATAASQPCELYDYHAPKVVRTQGHHRHPVYLQNRVYGRILDPELLWVCGSCHDAVHEWIGFLLGETRRPDPEPGRKAKAEAETTVAWFRAALRAAGLADGPDTPPEG